MHTKIPRYLLMLSATLFILFGCKKVAPSNEYVSPPGNVDTDHTIDYKLYTVSGSGGSPKGDIFLSFNTSSNGILAILDQDGYVIKEKTLALNVENFQKWVINGQTRYTYFQTDGPNLLDSLNTINLGYVQICDSAFNVLSTVKLLPYGNINTGVQDKLDEHEFILLGDNHYICETYYEEAPTNIPDSLNPAPFVRVAACIIQEVNNGQVVFQWDGTQFPELYANSQENNDFGNDSTTLDYMHLNSICIDSLDNNLIVSFRNLNEIVKLNRQTGQIMWRLGGNNSDFALTSDEMFLRQHYPRFIDSGQTQTLIFLDNGLAVVRPYSRILEFQLNETNKTINSFKAFTIPDTFIQFAGSVKKEGDDYFIGGGASPYSLEVNYITNEVLLRLNQNYSSYRAIKYD